MSSPVERPPTGSFYFRKILWRAVTNSPLGVDGTYYDPGRNCCGGDGAGANPGAEQHQLCWIGFPAPSSQTCRRRNVLVNAALLLMSSTLLVGADPAPPPAAYPTVAASGCCDQACGDPCCERTGLLNRIKGRLGHRRSKGDDCCAPAPDCCAPAPTICCAPPSPCDTCEPCCDSGRPNLLDRLRGHFRKKRGGDCCEPCPQPCDSGCGPGCTTVPHGAPAHGAPPAPLPPSGDIPKPMPKPSKPSASAAPVVPAPGTVVVPPVPLDPALAPSAGGSY